MIHQWLVNPPKRCVRPACRFPLFARPFLWRPADVSDTLINLIRQERRQRGKPVEQIAAQKVVKFHGIPDSPLGGSSASQTSSVGWSYNLKKQFNWPSGCHRLAVLMGMENEWNCKNKIWTRSEQWQSKKWLSSIIGFVRTPRIAGAQNPLQWMAFTIGTVTGQG